LKAAGGSPKGWISLYLIAFVLVLLAGGALMVSAKGFLSSTRLLWVSTGLSALAMVVAIVGLMLPRRR